MKPSLLIYAILVLSVPAAAQCGPAATQKKAQSGAAAAQNSVGACLVLSEKYRDALEWFGRSAKQGYPDAMFNIGAAFANGNGVDEDDRGAFAWFTMAAEAGSASAQEALKHLDIIDDDRALGMFLVGRFYETGTAVPLDTKKALVWYQRSADQKVWRAAARLCELYSEGKIVQRDMTTSNEYCLRAVGYGDAKSAWVLGQRYETGDGALIDLKKATEIYEEGSVLGNRQCATRLAEMYEEGKLVAADHVRSYVYFMLSAALGNTSSNAKAEALQGSMTSEEKSRAQGLISDLNQKLLARGRINP